MNQEIKFALALAGSVIVVCALATVAHKTGHLSDETTSRIISGVVGLITQVAWMRTISRA